MEPQRNARRLGGTQHTFGKTRLKTSGYKNGRGFLASLNKILLVERGERKLSGGFYDGQNMPEKFVNVLSIKGEVLST